MNQGRRGRTVSVGFIPSHVFDRRLPTAGFISPQLDPCGEGLPDSYEACHSVILTGTEVVWVSINQICSSLQGSGTLASAKGTLDRGVREEVLIKRVMSRFFEQGSRLPVSDGAGWLKLTRAVCNPLNGCKQTPPSSKRCGASAGRSIFSSLRGPSSSLDRGSRDV